METTTKSAFKSLTIWGLVLTSICSLIHNRTGVSVADQVQPVQDAVAGIIAGFQAMAPAIGQLAGAILVILGRFRASQPLHVFGSTPSGPSSPSHDFAAETEEEELPVKRSPFLPLLATGLMLSVALLPTGCATGSANSVSSDVISVLSDVQKASTALASSGAIPAGTPSNVVNDAATISNALETINTGQGITQSQALAVAQSFKSNASTTGYIQLAATVSQVLVPFVNSLIQQGQSPAQVQAQTTQVLTHLAPAVQAGIGAGN